MSNATPQTIEKAIALGRKMARRERNMKPILTDAYRFKSYLRFIIAHRDVLESRPEFVVWEARLCRIIEREHRLSKSPDAILSNYNFYNVQSQIRCAFWYGWETYMDLIQLYGQERIQFRPRERPTVLHVYTPIDEPAAVYA